jgi:erythromycin esterase
MKKIIIYIAFQVSFTVFTFAQQSGLKPFQSINPKNEDFTDLQFIKTEIGDKQIVMIGEQDHFAGASIDAKARIVNYLIKEMGFEVILFEAGFYDVQKSVEYLKKENRGGFRYSLYFLWAKSQNIIPFLDTLSKNAVNDKIYLDGFDPKFTSIYSSKFYISDLEQILNETEYIKSNQADWNIFKKLVQTAADKFDKKLTKFNAKERDLLYRVSRDINKVLVSANQTYWAQAVLTNTDILIEYSKISLKDMIANNEKAENLDNNRDSLMSENTKWLLENKYKGKKVIIWAASYHITKQPEIISSTSKDNFSGKKTLGGEIGNIYKDKVYSIGFISYQGKYGISFDKPKGTTMKPHNENSIEAYIHKYNYPFCWLTLKDNKNVIGKTAMINGFNNESYNSLDWSKNYDALIYIENMYPNTLK